MKKFQSPVYNVIAVPIEKIVPNTYNPNAVAPPEMKLLYESIKIDGYTMPIVCYHDKEQDQYIIVDGFHRYRIMLDHPDIYEREGGALYGVFSEEEIEAGTFVAEETDGQEHVYGISAERLYGLLNQGVDTRDLYIACTSYTQNTEYALKMIAWLGEQTQEEPPAWLEELEPIMDEETAQSLPEIG